MRILLAEDDYVTRKFMTGFLSKYGECDVTVDGMEVVDAFMMALEDEEPYDLVCLDIMMPVMDGYQALMGIRNLEDNVIGILFEPVTMIDNDSENMYQEFFNLIKKVRG